MPARLSDLLERIRPAGAPGAATEATTRRSRDAAEEIATISAAIGTFDREAEQEIARARAEAARMHTDAEQRARRILADVPDRIAGAAARAGGELGPASEDERARLAAEAAARVDRLRAHAKEHTPPVVDRAIASIWAMVTPPGGGS